MKASVLFFAGELALGLSRAESARVSLLLAGVYMVLELRAMRIENLMAVPCPPAAGLQAAAAGVESRARAQA